MKKITDIHNCLSNPTFLAMLWLLNKYGDIPGKFFMKMFDINKTTFSLQLKYLQSVGLIETYQSNESGREKIISLKRTHAAIFAYTLFIASEEPEMKEIEKKFLAGQKN